MTRIFPGFQSIGVVAALLSPVHARALPPIVPNDPIPIEPVTFAEGSGAADRESLGFDPGDAAWISDWEWPRSSMGHPATGTATPVASPMGAERVYHPGEVLSLNMTRAGQRAARDLGLVLALHPLRTTRMTLVRLRTPPELGAEEALAVLRERDPAGYYDLNPIYRLASAGAAACDDVRCYPQSMIAWNDSCSVRTRIGLLDGAVDRAHPALTSSRIRARRLAPGQPSAREAEHGTAIAALLVGGRSSEFPGLLPEAELVAADVFLDDGQGNLYTDAARMAAGLDWIAGHQPAAINISATGADSGVLHTVIHRVTGAGIPVVAAVGNHGPGAPPVYPAAYPEVVAVTAVDSRLRVYARANQGRHVALAAPGVDVWTPGAGGGVLREGTSFAAPYVTAAVARLKAAEPRARPASLAGYLRKTARPLGPPGESPVFGAGLLQAGRCGRD